jgi:hypothetical protein
MNIQGPRRAGRTCSSKTAFILKIKVVCFFETFGTADTLTQRDNSEELNRQHQRCEEPQYRWAINVRFNS